MFSIISDFRNYKLDMCCSWIGNRFGNEKTCPFKQAIQVDFVVLFEKHCWSDVRLFVVLQTIY